MTTRRLLPLLVLASLLSACAPELEEMPTPALDSLAPPARQRISRQQELVEGFDGESRAERSAAWGRLGRLFHAHSLWGAAVTAYENAARLEPDDPVWPYLEAHAHRQRGASDPAIEAFGAALELGVDPALPAHVWRARLLQDAGRPAEASQHLDAALAIEPENATALFLQGMLAAQRGDHPEAVRLYRLVLEVQPEADRTWIPLSASLRRTGDVEAADAALRNRGERAVSMADPLLSEVEELAISAPALVERAMELYRRGALDVAEELLREAMALDPGHVPAVVNLGVVSRARGNLPAAEAAFRRALGLEPRAVAHFDLGVVLAAQGKTEVAARSFEEALALDPDHHGARVNLGNSLARRGLCAEARAHFTRAVELDPLHPGGHRGLAHCAFLEEDWARAAAVLQEASRALPEDPVLRDFRARLASSSPRAEFRDPSRSLKLAEELVAERRTPRRLRTLALALAASERFDEAIERAEEALELARRAGRDDLVSELRGEIESYRAREAPRLE